MRQRPASNDACQSHGTASWRYKQVLAGTSSPEPQPVQRASLPPRPLPSQQQQPPRFSFRRGRPAWVLAAPPKSPPRLQASQQQSRHPVQLPGRGASNRGLATRRRGFRACAAHCMYEVRKRSTHGLHNRITPGRFLSPLPFLPQSNHNNTNPCKRFTSGISCHSLDRRASPSQRSPSSVAVLHLPSLPPALAHQGQHRCHWILLLLVRTGTPPRPLAVTQPLCQQNLHYGWPFITASCLLAACLLHAFSTLPCRVWEFLSWAIPCCLHARAVS